MNAKEIDICICFYNTPLKYFKECLNSIIKQTNKNFNLILLNDGSTNSDIEEYLKNEILNKKFGFDIYYYKQENKGCMYSRIKLFEYTISNYIYYMDSDDILYENSVDIIIESIRNNLNIIDTKPDIIQFDFIQFSKDYIYNDMKRGNKQFYGYIQNNAGILNLFLKNKLLSNSIWNKIFNRNILLKIFKKDFIEYFYKYKVFLYEDLYLLFFIYMNTQTYLHINKKIIKYRVDYDRHDNFYINKIDEFINTTNFIYALSYLEKNIVNSIDKENIILMKEKINYLYKKHNKIVENYLFYFDENDINKMTQFYNKYYSKITNFKIKDRKLISIDKNIL